MQLPNKPEELYTINAFDIVESDLVIGQSVLIDEFSDSTTFDRIEFVYLELESDFNENTNAEVAIEIIDPTNEEILFWTKRHIIQFAKWDFNTQHTGYFLFGLNLPASENPKLYRLYIYADEYFPSYKNMRLKIMRRY